MIRDLNKTIFLSIVLFSLSSHALIDVGVKGGMTNTNYSIFGLSASSSKNGTGYLYGVVLDVGALGLGVETGFYFVKRKPSFLTDGIESVYEINSYEVPLLVRWRFAGIAQTGLGLLYRRMKDKLNISSGGFNFETTHASAGLKKDDLAIMLQIGLRLPLGAMALTAEARGFLGLADLSTGGSLVTVHSLGGDLLAGIMF